MEKTAAEEEGLATQIACNFRVGLYWSASRAEAGKAELCRNCYAPQPGPLRSLGSRSSLMEGKGACYSDKETKLILVFVLFLSD